MASLPENWESDYDGDRWFFRFKPTGLVQYTFPKPGDEYPEFVDVFSPPPELSPEEKLESHYQVKRRNTAGGSAPQTGKSKDGLTSATMAGPGDDGENFWYQPDGLMYMGPGGYTDISPEEEDEAESAGFSHHENKDSATVESSPQKQLEPEPRSYISPVISAETTPLASNSHPATSPPLTNIVTVVDGGDAGRTDGGAAESPDGVPLLDGRRIQSPVGYMAELASELTAQCREETHPAPVELPTHDMTTEAAPQSLIYANAFDMAPVELPAHRSTRIRQAHDTGLDQKVLIPIPPLQDQDPHKPQPGDATAHQPPQTCQFQAPVRQNSMPLPTAEPSQSFTMPATPQPTPGKYQAYKPGRHVTAGGEGHGGVKHKPGPGMGGDSNYFPTRNLDGGNLAANAKRYSLAGPIPPRPSPEDVPAILQPPQVPPKRPLGRDDNDNDSYMLPGSGARHESISDHVGPRLVPSILQPGGGRAPSSVPRPSLQDHRAHSTPNYQPYNPYRDLEEHIESTAQLYSQSQSQSQRSQVYPSPAPSRASVMQASLDVKPAVNTSRANTLPFDMPTLPYMGVDHSRRAPAVQTIPESESSSQPENQLPTKSSRSDQGNKMAVFGDYSSPTIKSPDFPEPLKSFNKQPTDASNSQHRQSDATPLAHFQFPPAASSSHRHSSQPSASFSVMPDLSQASHKGVTAVNPPAPSSFQVSSHGRGYADSSQPPLIDVRSHSPASSNNAQGRPMLPHQQSVPISDRKTRIKSLDSAAGNTAPTTSATRRVSLSNPSHGFIVQSSAMPPPSVQSLRTESADPRPENGTKDPCAQTQSPPAFHGLFVPQQPTPGSQFHQREQGSEPRGQPTPARSHLPHVQVISDPSSAVHVPIRHSSPLAQGGGRPVPRPVSVILQPQEASLALQSRPSPVTADRAERLPTPQPVPLPTPPTPQQPYTQAGGTQSTSQARRIPLPVPVPQPSPVPRPSSAQPPGLNQAPPRPDKTPTTHAQPALSSPQLVGPASPTAARHGPGYLGHQAVQAQTLPPPSQTRTVQGSVSFGQPSSPEGSKNQPGPTPAISSGAVKAPPHMQTQQPGRPLSGFSLGTGHPPQNSGAFAVANPIMQQPSTQHILAPGHPTMTQQAGFVQQPGIPPHNIATHQPSMHVIPPQVGGMGAPHAMYFPPWGISQQVFAPQTAAGANPQSAFPVVSQPHASPVLNQAELPAQNTGAGKEKEKWFGKVFKSGSLKKQNPAAGAPASNDGTNKSTGGRSTPDSTTRNKLHKSQPRTIQNTNVYAQAASPVASPVVGPPVLVQTPPSQGNNLVQPSGPYFQPATGIPQWANPQNPIPLGGQHFAQQGVPQQQQIPQQLATYPLQSHPPQNQNQFGQPQQQHQYQITQPQQNPHHVKQNQPGQQYYYPPVGQQSQSVDRTQRYPGNMPYGTTNPGVAVPVAGRTVSSPPDAVANRRYTAASSPTSAPKEALSQPAQSNPPAPEHDPHHPSETTPTTVHQESPSKASDVQDNGDRDSLSRKSIASSIAPSFTNSITTESGFTTARYADNDTKTGAGSTGNGASSAANDRTGFHTTTTTTTSAPNTGNHLTSTANAHSGIGDVSAVGDVLVIGPPATSVSDIAVAAAGEDKKEPASPPASIPTPAPASKWDSSGYDGSGWGDDDEDEYDYDGGYGRGGYGGGYR